MVTAQLRADGNLSRMQLRGFGGCGLSARNQERYRSAVMVGASKVCELRQVVLCCELVSVVYWLREMYI